MEEQVPQFVGPPCGHYGSHTFYRGFKYNKQGKLRNVNLGDFFFIRISAEDDPCIGELQLLFSKGINEPHLSSIRLYFLPEQTPDGRLSHHGEHELLVASDRVVLKLEDLVSWITDEVEWNHGIFAPFAEKTVTVKQEKTDVENDNNNNSTASLETSENEDSTAKEMDQKKTVDIKEETIKEIDEVVSKGTKVIVLSYQSYCRYRTILKRIDGGNLEEWMLNALVLALGGISPSNAKTRVLFCRETFEHDELAHHELNYEHLAPVIKGKRRKRKTKNARSVSPESNSSSERKDIDIKNNQKTSGIKQPPIKCEQEFLSRLFKFMKKRNTPIHRVPHLGFKQIDLYKFYSFGQKLGGYDKITTKKMWKHVYDELGGNPGSTSAATCTRRHYEKLLLPFERFMEGILYKPTQRGKKSQKKKLPLPDQEHPPEEEMKEDPQLANNSLPAKAESVNGVSAEAEDAYMFTDSNQENSNSKDSNSNEFNSLCDDQALTNEPPFSDEDSKTVWSIQRQPENRDETNQDRDEEKHIKPLIIQKGQGESFSDKEKRWDEIRKSRAAQRKWERQSKSSRGCKTPIPEVPPFKIEKQTSSVQDIAEPQPVSPALPLKVKTEFADRPPSVPIPSASPDKVISDNNNKVPHVLPAVNHNTAKFLPPVTTTEAINDKTKIENHSHKRRHVLAKETPSQISSDKKYLPVKVDNEKRSNSWGVYPTNPPTTSPYQSSHPPRIDNYSPGLHKSHLPLPYKPGLCGEMDNGLEYPLHAGRRSVGSVSASSATSVDASGGEEKPLVPQRRPSVIQHTEYAATSPSPSVSPKQSSSDLSRNMSPKDSLQPFPYMNAKMNLPLGYSTQGKVAEWLTKGVHEVVACKTPSATIHMDKSMELKVMTPSSCKTPGIVGTSKIPVNSVKSKQNSASKPPRSKYSSSHRHRNMDGVMNGNFPAMPSARSSATAQQKMQHQPIPSTYPVLPNNVPKYHKQAANQKGKTTEFYPNGPYYNQSKRYKVNHMAPTMVGPINPRVAQSPFIRQQTYCTPPMSDIPKPTATTHNDYESAVLDLSVRKKPPVVPPPPRPVAPISISPAPEEGVCLDLSIKKKPEDSLPLDNGIENITPPLSPVPSSQSISPYMPSTLKPLPNLISLQDLAAEEAVRRSFNGRVPPIIPSTGTSQVSGSHLPIPPPVSALYSGGAHGKLPPGLVGALPPVTYHPKDMPKNLYIPGSTRHSQFPPYVIPPYFSSSWATVMNTTPPNSKQISNSHTSPMTYKGMANHNVFPKDYPYNVKSSQYHPVLCKDSVHYPSNESK